MQIGVRENQHLSGQSVILKLKKEITFSITELAGLLEREFFGFLQLCKGKNKKYTMWFSYMLAELNEEELPYAFSDYYNDRDFWQTSQGKKIKSFNESY